MGEGGFFFAIVFFLMLFCLGIDSQFAMVESVMTVLHDAKIGNNLSKPVLAGIVCGVNFLLGLVFMTRAGIHWFTMFDNYSALLALFFVCALECIGLVWANAETWRKFKAQVRTWTGRSVGPFWEVTLRYVTPMALIALLVASMVSEASNFSTLVSGGNYTASELCTKLFGWIMALAPVVTFVVIFLIPPENKANEIAACA